jgi:eukaryotic-like serine/threonine-protein kinase
MTLAAGTRLGDYEILGEIGRGGMGTVYRARDAALDRTLALKVLSADAASEPQELARFEQEARATSALSHPHIVQVFDLAATKHEKEKLHYIAMELVEGRSLRELLAGPTPLDEILEILAQVADALDKAHQTGIVHRDVKPENVLVTEDGYAKLVDFGVAKLVGSADRNARRFGPAPDDSLETQVGEMMGTLAYMAPEQISGAAVDGRTDVFALGNIVFEAVMGFAPFRREGPAKTLRAIMNEQVPEFTGPKRVAPLSLENIIRKCLAKNPEERFSSSGEVAELLRAVKRELRSDPISWIPVERFGFRRELLVIGVLIVVLLVVFLFALAKL